MSTLGGFRLFLFVINIGRTLQQSAEIILSMLELLARIIRIIRVKARNVKSG